MPKIPDAADKIEVRAAMRNLEELRRGVGLNHLHIAHLPHPPTHSSYSAAPMQSPSSSNLAWKRLSSRPIAWQATREHQRHGGGGHQRSGFKGLYKRQERHHLLGEVCRCLGNGIQRQQPPVVAPSAACHHHQMASPIPNVMAAAGLRERKGGPARNLAHGRGEKAFPSNSSLL
jgi:hypothetical protein